MGFQDFLAYVRSLGWKVWALTAATAFAIMAFCGIVLGPILLAISGIALVPAVRIGMRAEYEKRRRSELE